MLAPPTQSPTLAEESGARPVKTQPGNSTVSPVESQERSGAMDAKRGAVRVDVVPFAETDRSTKNNADTLELRKVRTGDISLAVIPVAIEPSVPSNYPPLPLTLSLPEKLILEQTDTAAKSYYSPGDILLNPKTPIVKLTPKECIERYHSVPKHYKSWREDPSYRTNLQLNRGNNHLVEKLPFTGTPLEIEWKSSLSDYRLKEHGLVSQFASEATRHDAGAARDRLVRAGVAVAKSLVSSGKMDAAASQYRALLYAGTESGVPRKELDLLLRKAGVNPQAAAARIKLSDSLVSLQDKVVELRIARSLEDTPANRVREAEALLKADKIIDGFLELKSVVVSRDATPADLAKAHHLLAGVLENYAHLALGNDQKRIAVKRMANAWIEYRRALFFDPLDKEALGAMRNLAELAVGIEDTFDNNLALAGAASLSGEKELAARCYQRCRVLNPDEPITSGNTR